MIGLIKKDLRMIARERTIMSAISILVFVASFSSLVTFGLIFLYSPDAFMFTEVNVGVAGNCPILKSYGDRAYDSLSTALSDFYSGKVDAVLYLPEENISSINTVTLYISKNDISGVIAFTKAKKILQEYEKALRLQKEIPGDDGFEMRYVDGRNAESVKGLSMTYRFIYAILIPLLLVTTAVISGGLVVDIITEEWETKTLHVITSTPMSLAEFIYSKLVTSFIISSMLSAIWIFMMEINMGVSNTILLFVLSVSFSAILSALSSIISSALKDRERSQLLFSILMVSIVTVSFSSPSMIAGVSARVSAGSLYSIQEVLVYPALTLILTPISARISEKLLENN